MDGRYLELMNRVLVSNYWGEVVVAGVLTELLDKDPDGPASAAFRRILSDEHKHGGLVRGLLNRRGLDPAERSRPDAFAYRTLFEEFAQKPEHRLPFLAEFERMSGPTFGGLVRLARSIGDQDFVDVYAEILRDEVVHARVLEECLPPPDRAKESRAEAHARMKQVMNWDYMRLYMAFPLDPGAGRPR